MKTPCPEVGLVRSSTGTLHEYAGTEGDQPTTGCGIILSEGGERCSADFNPKNLCARCYPKLSWRDPPKGRA